MWGENIRRFCLQTKRFLCFVSFFFSFTAAGHLSRLEAAARLGTECVSLECDIFFVLLLSSIKTSAVQCVVAQASAETWLWCYCWIWKERMLRTKNIRSQSRTAIPEVWEAISKYKHSEMKADSVCFLWRFSIFRKWWEIFSASIARWCRWFCDREECKLGSDHNWINKHVVWIN